MSMEMNKALDLLREIRPSIPKEVLELWCKDRDAFIASHPAAEQAGGDRWDALQSIMEWTAAENIPDERKLCLIRNAARAALAEVERLREENANLILACASLDSEKREMQHKWDAIIAMRDAALARVAEMERQEPVATVAKVPGEDWNSLDFHRDLQHMQPGTKLYAAPVAQAGQVPEGVRILLARAQGQIEHLAECTENLGEDLDDDYVSEDVAEAREVAEEIAELLATAPGKEVGHE